MAAFQAESGNINTISEIIKKLSISDVNVMKENFSCSHILNASCAERMNPLAYFSTTFKFPAALMSAMFDSGCILSGLRALEFFISGSTQSDAEWDFYVPGYKESIADMVTALSICGVTWDLYGQDIIEDLKRNGSTVVSRKKLMALSTWAQEKTTYLLGEQLYSILRLFNMKFNTIELESDSFTIELWPNGKTDIIPNGKALDFQDLPHEDPSGQPFNILHGTIPTAGGIEKVQLIIGSYYKGTMDYIKNFQASHLQGFIGGWCAAHMYYQQTSINQSTLWEPATYHGGFSSKRLINQHQNKKYTFTKANTSITRTRKFGDSESLFLDYGELYYSFISHQNYNKLDLWLAERRKNMHSISWIECKGRLLNISSSWEKSFWTCNKSLTRNILELPEYHQRRLANMIAVDAQSPDPMRSKGFQSSLGRNVMTQGWQMIVLARSGTVFHNLRDATPWSWIF